MLARWYRVDADADESHGGNVHGKGGGGLPSAVLEWWGLGLGALPGTGVAAAHQPCVLPSSRPHPACPQINNMVLFSLDWALTQLEGGSAELRCAAAAAARAHLPAPAAWLAVGAGSGKDEDVDVVGDGRPAEGQRRPAKRGRPRKGRGAAVPEEAEEEEEYREEEEEAGSEESEHYHPKKHARRSRL